MNLTDAERSMATDLVAEHNRNGVAVAHLRQRLAGTARRLLAQPAWLLATWMLVAWTVATLGAAILAIWLAIHNSACSDSVGIVMFCRYNAAMRALGSGLGPLAAYGVGTLLLGAWWARALQESPACSECGSHRRADGGACRRCGFDPFASKGTA